MYTHTRSNTQLNTVVWSVGDGDTVLNCRTSDAVHVKFSKRSKQAPPDLYANHFPLAFNMKLDFILKN